MGLKRTRGSPEPKLRLPCRHNFDAQSTFRFICAGIIWLIRSQMTDLHPVTKLPNINVFYEQFNRKVAPTSGAWGIIILDVRATQIMNETLSYGYFDIFPMSPNFLPSLHERNRSDFERSWRILARN